MTTIAATKARSNFYSLIKNVSQGLKTFEITLRGQDPVVLINKQDLESLQETAEILSIPGARQSIIKGLSQSRTKHLSHQQILDKLKS